MGETCYLIEKITSGTNGNKYKLILINFTQKFDVAIFSSFKKRYKPTMENVDKTFSTKGQMTG